MPLNEPSHAHLLDGPAAELDVERLPADDVAGAGHDVRGGDAAGRGHADAGIVRVDGVDAPARSAAPARSSRCRRNCPARPAGVQTPMCECVSTRPGMTTAPARSIDFAHRPARADIVFRADRFDLAVLHHEHRVGTGLSPVPAWSVKLRKKSIACSRPPGLHRRERGGTGRTTTSNTSDAEMTIGTSRTTVRMMSSRAGFTEPTRLQTGSPGVYDPGCMARRDRHGHTHTRRRLP